MTDQLSSTDQMYFDKETLEAEAQRLFQSLKKVGFDLELCRDLAETTLEIKYWKNKRNAVILAHSYQTPDILFGIADFRGDSFYLAKKSQDLDADTIVFCGVEFMAETAKILNPNKTVLLPSPEAGCSLADSITAEDVKKLKRQFPNRPVVTYINTSAAVKAESDIIVTSANAPKIIRNLQDKEIIFLPDKYMSRNLAKMVPEKTFLPLNGWEGVCIVHEEFSKDNIVYYKKQFGDDLKILIHTECAPEVVEEADMAGGTGDMIRYIKEHPEIKKFMLVTECGLTERLKVEFPDREFVGTCNLCPYMKKITLDNVLQVLKDPKDYNIIEVDELTRKKALKALERMFELSK